MEMNWYKMCWVERHAYIERDEEREGDADISRHILNQWITFKLVGWVILIWTCSIYIVRSIGWIMHFNRSPRPQRTVPVKCQWWLLYGDISEVSIYIIFIEVFKMFEGLARNISLNSTFTWFVYTNCLQWWPLASKAGSQRKMEEAGKCKVRMKGLIFLEKLIRRFVSMVS